MRNRIFGKRLQNQVQCTVIQNILRYIHFNRKAVVMKHFLNLQIRTHIVDLLADGHRIFAFVQGSPVVPRKRQRRLADIIRTDFQRFPVDQRQGIIQKMRVNLCAERRHLILFLADAALIDFLNQLTDTRQHLIKATRQITDFISFRRNHFHFQVSFLYLGHRLFQLFKAVRHISGESHNHDRREKDAACPHQKNYQKNRLHRTDDAFFRQIARGMPSILLNLLFQENVVRCILLLFFLYLLKV